MSEASAFRDPRDLSDLNVEEIFSNARKNGKTYKVLEALSSNPGAAMFGKEEELLTEFEQAKLFGFDNIKYFPPEEGVKFARLESVKE